MERSLKIVKKHTIETDPTLPIIYGKIANYKKRILYKSNYLEPKNFFRRKLKSVTMIFGNESKSSISTKISIAECERLDKDLLLSLKTLDGAYQTNLFQ